MRKVLIGDEVPAVRQCGGIRTLEDLKSRCVIDDLTGCWRWSLSKNPEGAAKVHVRFNGKPETIQGRRAAFALTRGHLPPKGHRIYAVAWCPHRDCCNPDHARAGTVSQHGEAMAKSGKLKNLPSKVRAARDTARKYLAKLTMEQARQIRAAEGRPADIAKEFGVHTHTVWAIKQNVRYRETSNVMPTADVFAWAQNVVKEAA